MTADPGAGLRFTVTPRVPADSPAREAAEANRATGVAGGEVLFTTKLLSLVPVGAVWASALPLASPMS